MNDIKETTQAIITLIGLMIFGLIIGTIAHVGYIYYSYIKVATVGMAAFALAMVVISGTGGLVYGMATLWLRLQSRRADIEKAWADAEYRRNEANGLSQKLTVIKSGEELVITHVNYPMRLINHSSPHGLKADLAKDMVQQLLLPAPVDTDIMAGIRTGQKWIEEFLFDENDKLISPHYSVNGPTGVGKTHLVLYIMSLIQQPYPKAEYWLLDPKFEGKKSGWPFVPFVEDFEDMAAGAQYVYDNVVTKRKHNNRNDIEPEFPAFVIVDEVDGSADDHGDKFVKPLRKGIKEGRSGLTYYFIVGQSSLIKENKLSGAIFRNTTRFVMGNEALAFTRNAQFTFWDKAARELIAKQLITLQEQGRRAVLVIPMDGQGLPFVGEIPNLPKPSFSQAAKVEEASKLLLDIGTMTVTEVKPLKSGLTNEQEMAICDMYAEGYTLEEIASEVLGNTGGKQNVKLLNVLVAHEVKLLPKHAAKLAKVKG
jgi:hypothetical protein